MGLYYNGHVVTPTLIVPRDIYDNVQNSGTSNIILDEVHTIYSFKPTSDSTISFETHNLLNINTEYVTFMLILDFTDGLYNITWPNTVEWGNIPPTMSANVKYMFSFTKPAGVNKWIGNQMYSFQ